MRDFFILKKLNRSHHYAFSFLVKKASALLASVLAPNANLGFKGNSMKKIFIISAIAVALLAPQISHAKEKNIIKFGRDIKIGANRVVRGVAAVAGDVTVDGTVEDDVVAVGGSVKIGPAAVIGGNVVSVGGIIDKNTKAQVTGNIVEVNIPGFSSLTLTKYKTRKFHFLIKAVSFVGLAALSLFVIAIVPEPVRKISHIIEFKTIVAISWSIRALLTIVPLAVILTMSVAGIFLIPLEVILVVGAMLFGYIITAKIIGKAAINAIFKRGDLKEWNAVLGITLLELFGFVPVIGWLVRAVVALIGFGGVIAALFPDKKRKQEHAEP